MPVQMRPMRLALILMAIAIAGFMMHGPWAISPVRSLFLKAPVGLLCVALFLSAVTPHLYGFVGDRLKKFLSAR